MANFLETSANETERYLAALANNVNCKNVSFEEFVNPYLVKPKLFMQNFNISEPPQSVIISISRWPNNGICITLSYLKANNEHIVEFIWNPPQDNVLKIMTLRINNVSRTDIKKGLYHMRFTMRWIFLRYWRKMRH